MSDTVGSGSGSGSGSGIGSGPADGRTAGWAAGRTDPANVREAYSFACMRCGHGWEQAYEIEHHVDTSGRPYVTYLADGAAVPSPLTRPSCGNCGGHLVRIMRAGQVDEAVSRWHAHTHASSSGHTPSSAHTSSALHTSAAAHPQAKQEQPPAAPHARHWSLLALLHRGHAAPPRTARRAAP
ncbi:hypothetical protein [Streptomyces sp. CA2R106]|uniref:hypothetical protein n=1 Tax=Streptomyces sp. CA2R106 TaxID=3120153 RepID=UPI003FA704F0